MCKTIRKVLFGDLHNIQEYEEYFSEMSRKGLHLKEVGMFFANFEESNPQYLNYRIDIAKKDNKEEMINKHKAEGWSFIDEKDSFLIFSTPVGSGLKELYKTPEAQKLSLRAAMKDIFGGKATNIIIGLIALIILVVIAFEKIRISHGLYIFLTKEEIGISFVFFLFSLMRSRSKKRNLLKIEKILDSGMFLSHSGDYYLMKSKFIFRNITFSIITILLFGSMIFKMYQGDSVNLTEISDLDSLPMVTVGDIETMEYQHENRMTFSSDNNIDYGNVLYRDWSLFIPKENTLVQSVILYDKNHNRTENKPFLTADYYLTRFDFVAKGLEQDILVRESKRFELKPIELQSKENFACYGGKKGDTIILLCRKGKQVTLVIYSDGTVTVEDLAKVVAKKLDYNDHTINRLP